MSSLVLSADSRLRLVASDNGHRSLHAAVAFGPGDTLTTYRIVTIIPAPTRHSIQVSVSEHALIEPELLRFVNHSCATNVVFDVGRKCVRVIRRISVGDEIVYFYPSTEWSMAQPFDCHCKAPGCLERIAGAAHLPLRVLAEHYLSEHVTTLLAERRRLASTPSEFSETDFPGAR